MVMMAIPAIVEEASGISSDNNKKAWNKADNYFVPCLSGSTRNFVQSIFARMDVDLPKITDAYIIW